ncbi:MAG TPA: HPr family phosphocarrier protein [Candidatus Limnocylindria bacterium]|nr:HPr family phosphocarrier protein [Candidatus Limnocylindria bacterium]
MTEIHLTIRNEDGMHARSAAKFVTIAARFKSHVFVSRDDLEVNGKSILGVLMLAAEGGSVIKVRAEGEDEREVIAALAELVDARFGFEQ